ncbi:MAG: aspartate aminotransferase family protein [Acidimicrobiia bacterium]
MNDIRRTAQDHLWLHFAQIPSEGPVVIERGEGCYIWDTDGNRYLDALAGLFVSAIGHGRSELANAASKQAEQLAYFPVWGLAHRPAADLAAKLAELSPGDMDRVFFTTGGSEAVESAWKLARQYFLAKGEPDRMKVVARRTAYHGTTFGALSITSIETLREPYEPLLNHMVTHVSTTNHPHGDNACTLECADEIEQAILAEGPETVAAVFLEPVQSSGGCFVPPEGYWQRVREICDRYGVLLVSDEVICAFGRLGNWFGGQRFDYVPDMITFAKGVTSGYAPLGGVITRPFIADAFIENKDKFMHGITFGGHPVSSAVALANIEVMESEGLIEHVAANEHLFRAELETLLDLPIVSEVRGTGYFYAIELQKDARSGIPFSPEEAAEIVALLNPVLLERGLIARADGRGSPIIQFSPPLIAGPAEFTEIARITRESIEHVLKTAPT